MIIGIIDSTDVSPEIAERIKHHLANSDSNTKRDSSIIYNTDLLDYSGIVEIDTEFTNSLLTTILLIIFIISFFSIVILYTSFKITFSERIKEFRNVIFYWYE